MAFGFIGHGLSFDEVLAKFYNLRSCIVFPFHGSFFLGSGRQGLVVGYTKP